MKLLKKINLKKNHQIFAAKKTCIHLLRISNLKWYQPSVDTTVVKQYGPQAKINVSPISRFKYKEKLLFNLILFV